jgi:tricorn protease
VASKEQTMIAPNREGGADFAWAPDSRWIAWSQSAANSFAQILLYNVETKKTSPLTTDRVNSASASWSPDGKWLYFLSDRNLDSVVGAPWGPRAPQPFFDKPMRAYQVALKKGLRSPFKPADELHPETPEKPEPKADASAGGKPAASPQPSPSPSPSPTPAVASVDIDLEGLQQRLYEVTPAGSGDFDRLTATAKAIFWTATDPGSDGKRHLMALEITGKDPKPVKVMEDISPTKSRPTARR